VVLKVGEIDLGGDFEGQGGEKTNGAIGGNNTKGAKTLKHVGSIVSHIVFG